MSEVKIDNGDLEEYLKSQVNEIMNDENNEENLNSKEQEEIKDVKEQLKEKIYNEIINSTNIVSEELVKEAVENVFDNITPDKSYLDIDDIINETMQGIINEHGEDNEKEYHKLDVELQNKFELNRKELIDNGIVTDIINFDDNFEIEFDELNERISQTEIYLNEFFELRDKKIEIIKDTNLSLDEKKKKILEINNSSNLLNIENDDVKREYELFTQSSDEDLLNIFNNENIDSDELSKSVEEYINNWNDVVEKIYGIDVQNMDILSKQIDVVLDNANKELADEYIAMCKELGFEKGSEEERIFDEAFEKDCNEQLYIDKMIEIKINDNDEINKIDEQISQIEEELISLDTALGEMDESEIREKRKELKNEKKELISNKEKTISDLKENLSTDLHDRFERMANYQKKAIRYTKLIEKFDEHKKFTLNTDLNRSVKEHSSLNEAMNYKNNKSLENIFNKIPIDASRKVEIDSDNKGKDKDKETKVQEKDKKENKDNSDIDKKDDTKNKDKDKDKTNPETKTTKTSQSPQIIYQQQPTQENENQNNGLKEISKAQSSKNIIEDFLGKTPSLKKEYLLKNGGFIKLSDAIEILGNNNEGYSLSRKERKNLLNSINSEMKQSLNEEKLTEKSDDIINLFTKLNDGDRDSSVNLFNELFTYNKATKLPFIAESLIEKKDQHKLAGLLENYTDLLKNGDLTESEIENFERFVLNPLNSNVIKQGISDMGFFGRLKNRFSKSNVKPFYALNSSLKDLNEVRTLISKGKYINGPIAFENSVYSDKETIINQVEREGKQHCNETPVVTPQQK